MDLLGFTEMSVEPPAYAGNFHGGGGFIQWHMVVIFI